jgi:hypothetical protein
VQEFAPDNYSDTTNRKNKNTTNNDPPDNNNNTVTNDVDCFPRQDK